MTQPKTNLEIIQDKIFNEDELMRQLLMWRFYGKKIVFTNGCFDLLHKGHVHYLAQARDLGDVLVIGLNSDSSVRTLGKGPARPLQDESARALILASLHVVSAVVLFSTTTPESLIELVQPDVLVKGGDYQDLTQIVGYETVMRKGGIVTTIPFIDGYSTTAIENKIKSEH
jgi:rfaE bifunctional protein nucleotidyltransferase chain/domain